MLITCPLPALPCLSPLGVCAIALTKITGFKTRWGVLVVTLCPGPEEAGGAAHARHEERPKRFLNAKVGFYWRRNWSRQLCTIENTQPTAWLRQSKNRKGSLKRGIAYLRLLLAAASPAPWLAGVSGSLLVTPVPGLLPICLCSLPWHQSAGSGLDHVHCPTWALGPLLLLPREGKISLGAAPGAASLFYKVTVMESKQVKWALSVTESRPSGSCLCGLFYSLLDF